MTHLVPVLRPVLGSPFRRGDLYRIAGAMPALHLSPRITGTWNDLISGQDLTTFSRANTSPTYELDGAGGLVAFTSGQRAVGYSPETGVRGGSIFGQRTQLLASPDAPATQSVTLSAVQHQLTLFGTGSVTLSGAATGTLTGTGASNRVSLSFTPTAGSVTFTVSGSVSRFNLTAGSVVYPHLGGAITCPADVLTIGGLNLSGGTVLIKASSSNVAGTSAGAVFLDVGSGGSFGTTNYLAFESNSWQLSPSFPPSNISSVLSVSAGTKGVGTIAARLKTNDSQIAVNGTLGSLDSSCTVSSNATTLTIGNGGWSGANSHWNGHIHDILYWPPGSPAENRLQQLSAALP